MTAWIRVEPGECSCHRPSQVHSGWRLPGETHPSGALKTAGRTISDEAIRTFGRPRIEQILAGLPALPESAWSVLS